MCLMRVPEEENREHCEEAIFKGMIKGKHFPELKKNVGPQIEHVY